MPAERYIVFVVLKLLLVCVVIAAVAAAAPPRASPGETSTSIGSSNAEKRANLFTARQSIEAAERAGRELMARLVDAIINNREDANHEKPSARRSYNYIHRDDYEIQTGLSAFPKLHSLKFLDSGALQQFIAESRPTRSGPLRQFINYYHIEKPFWHLVKNNYQTNGAPGNPEDKDFYLSELLYVGFHEANRQRRKFKDPDLMHPEWILRSTIKSMGTDKLLEEIRPQERRRDMIQEAYEPGSLAAAAILGTAHAKTIMHLLRDHHRDFGDAVVTDIYTYKNPHGGWNILFHLEKYQLLPPSVRAALGNLPASRRPAPEQQLQQGSSNQNLLKSRSFPSRKPLGFGNLT